VRPTPLKCACAAAALAFALAGCGATDPSSAPLGRALDAPTAAAVASSPAAAVATPAGDPPHERGGQVPAVAAATEDRPASAGLARSPTVALTRYALSYTNWRASQLVERERQLASMSVGAARLSAEQTAAGGSGALALATHNVANAGQVVAVAPGEGRDRGQWVIVTWERTTGSGPYAELPAGPHVTLARVARIDGRWAVSTWDPIS
jgi:hypothetical protein